MSNTFNSPALLSRSMPPQSWIRHPKPPQTHPKSPCLWIWGHNYCVLTFPLQFGVQKYWENSCKVCTHWRACYTNSVSFFLVWTALRVDSTTSVQSNYWKLENVQDDVRYKQPFERKRARWKPTVDPEDSCSQVTFWFSPVNQICVFLLHFPTVNTTSCSYFFIICEWNASMLQSLDANICFWWCGFFITQVAVAKCFGSGQLDLCSVARRCSTKSTWAAQIWMSWNLFKYSLTF